VKHRATMVGALLLGLLAAPLASAQDGFMPKLGDIMGIIQLRHIKLGFAGKLGNWPLADYEAGQIKSSLEDAAGFYRSIPVEALTLTADPLKRIGEANAAKDEASFAKAYGDLTAACNACHVAVGRPFIVIQVPTASPFSDQSFAPAAKP
jgi:hypothetical protein